MSAFKWVPNALTFSRLCLAVPVTVLLLTGSPRLTLFLLFIAVLTDLLDGIIARNFNARSDFGSWLDPAADKVMITAVLLTLTVKGELPGWFCYLTVGRDIGLVLGVLFLLSIGRKIRIQPLLTGKLATVAQNIALLLAILAEIGWARGSVKVFVVISAALTCVSAVTYGRKFGKVFLRKD